MLHDRALKQIANIQKKICIVILALLAVTSGVEGCDVIEEYGRRWTRDAGRVDTRITNHINQKLNVYLQSKTEKQHNYVKFIITNR